MSYDIRCSFDDVILLGAVEPKDKKGRARVILLAVKELKGQWHVKG
jgi:hypothetical protein